MPFRAPAPRYWGVYMVGTAECGCPCAWAVYSGRLSRDEAQAIYDKITAANPDKEFRIVQDYGENGLGFRRCHHDDGSMHGLTPPGETPKFGMAPCTR